MNVWARSWECSWQYQVWSVRIRVRARVGSWAALVVKLLIVNRRRQTVLEARVGVIVGRGYG